MDCPLCELAQSPEKKLYEDDHVFCILNTGPAAPGQVIAAPKQHATILEQLSPGIGGFLFVVATKMAEALYAALDTGGTNILVQNGGSAGQTTPHIMVHIIPRMDNDGLGLTWTPRELSEEALDAVRKQVKEALATLPEEKEYRSQSDGAEGSAGKREPPSQPVLPEHLAWEDNLMKHLKRRMP